MLLCLACTAVRDPILTGARTVIVAYVPPSLPPSLPPCTALVVPQVRDGWVGAGESEHISTNLQNKTAWFSAYLAS